MSPAAQEIETGPDALAPKVNPENKKDFSDEVHSVIPQASALARSGKLTDALEMLLSLEKRARLGGDLKSVGEVALVIVKLCLEMKDLDQLNSNITLLCKRRGQFKQVQVTVIQEAASRVGEVENKEDKLKLIDTLRAVSEGKIYVEAERARLTFTLAMIREAEGNIALAADILQEEQVETYGAMSKREKIEYLLEEVRLCLAKKDMVRAYIISKKVNKKILDEVDLEDLKIRFYRLLIEYFTFEKNALELARASLAIYKCKSIMEHPKKCKETLESSVLYLCLAPYDNHQIDLVHITLEDINLEKLPSYKALLSHFVRMEVAQWPLPEHDELHKHPLLADKTQWYGSVLKDRVIEHDIRVVARYYTRIRADRIAEILQLSKDVVERYVSAMVTSTTSERLPAKIDRPAEIYTFEMNKDANAYLTDWADDISELLLLVDKTCHLIHKETMLHNAKQ